MGETWSQSLPIHYNDVLKSRYGHGMDIFQKKFINIAILAMYSYTGDSYYVVANYLLYIVNVLLECLYIPEEDTVTHKSFKY